MSRRAAPRDDLVAESEAMGKLVEAISALAAERAPVLVCGEHGVGRARVGRALHRAGPRGDAEIVIADAGAQAMPAEVEAALLGGRAGAVLIRDLGQASRAAQERLCQLITDSDAARGRAAAVRFIATCDPEVHAAADAGWFDGRLMARLGAHVIDVPPLRERVADIVPLFARQVHRRAAALGRGRLRITGPAGERLAAYSWPGNVAELERVADRVVMRARGSRVEPGDIDAVLPVMSERVPLERISFEDMVRGKLVEFLRSVDGYSVSDLYEHVLARVERPLLGLIMERTGGNQVRAAEILGLNRNTLRRKLSERKLLVRGKAELRTKSKSRAGRRAKSQAS